MPKNICSSEPRQVEPGQVWYYENPASIEIYMDHDRSAYQSIKITRRMLEASLKRMNASRKRKK